VIRRWCLCVLLVMMVGVFSACGEKGVLLVEGTTESSAEDVATEEVDVSLQPESVSVILVHVCGAVAFPGVYELEGGSRIYQLIELAGGFAPDAAKGYLNLAGSLYDGQKIVVPTVSEAEDDPYGEKEPVAETVGSVADDRLININTADKAQLMTLPGIGEAKASAIIARREEHGAFRTKEEIMQVPGIKEAAYEKIKSLITVD